MFIRTFAVSSGFEVDLVRVEVTPGRQAPARPVEEVPPGNVVVNVPLVVKRIILATIRVDKRFHEYQRIFKWVVRWLPAKHGIFLYK